ncbi:MAG: 50S ribosomal protein L20 [Opitutales bacterium]|nr:50S ribosomal protein L20 [Opitutales bacterium]
MSKVNTTPASRARRKKVLQKAKGYFGNKSRLYRYAKGAVERAEQSSYRDRRKKKADFRQLWIVRINASCRPLGLSYSQFMAGLRMANVGLDRKAISELAIHDAAAFAQLVDVAKKALAEKAA